MEPRKETIKEPKAPASAASKAPSTRKQPAAQSGSGAQAGGGDRQAGDQQQAENLLQHAKQATGEIANQVQQRAGSQLGQQKENAATDLSKVANAVRQFGQNLTENESGAIGRYVAEYGDKAAHNLERFANYLREQDPKQLVNDVQNFGRRQPALLLGGAFLLGLAGARLIKSSMNAANPQSFNPNASATRQPSQPAATNAL